MTRTGCAQFRQLIDRLATSLRSEQPLVQREVPPLRPVALSGLGACASLEHLRSSQLVLDWGRRFEGSLTISRNTHLPSPRVHEKPVARSQSGFKRIDLGGAIAAGGGLPERVKGGAKPPEIEQPAQQPKKPTPGSSPPPEGGDPPEP